MLFDVIQTAMWYNQSILARWFKKHNFPDSNPPKTNAWSDQKSVVIKNCFFLFCFFDFWNLFVVWTICKPTFLPRCYFVFWHFFTKTYLAATIDLTYFWIGTISKSQLEGGKGLGIRALGFVCCSLSICNYRHFCHVAILYFGNFFLHKSYLAATIDFTYFWIGIISTLGLGKKSLQLLICSIAFRIVNPYVCLFCLNTYLVFFFLYFGNFWPKGI